MRQRVVAAEMAHPRMTNRAGCPAACLSYPCGLASAMLPWRELDRATAPDGAAISLHQRGHEFLIRAGGHDLMSSHDDVSSRALARLGCDALRSRATPRVLVGGLGMGFTLRAALDAVGPQAIVEVAELVDHVVQWNQGPLAALAGRPLDDPRTRVFIGDVRDAIRKGSWDAVLLDVDNGPDALAHDANDGLYGRRGIAEAWAGLQPGGVYGVWSFSDDPKFTRRLSAQGFDARVERIKASRRGRGRHHYVWVARR